MKNKIGKIIKIVLLCLVLGVISYLGTGYLDRQRKGGEVKVTVTFDDTETYQIPSIKVMTEEEALKEWPYIMEVENTGDKKGLYQMIITETSLSTIKRDNLNYALYLDEEMVSKGKLNEIKNDILYTYEINGNIKQKYKLYIWVTSEVEENAIYEYKIEFNTIKDGGPGF